MNIDDFGCVINGPETYGDIAGLLPSSPALIAWTEGRSTQYDILFAIQPHVAGLPQGGIHAGHLFVSIMRVGAWGFEIRDDDVSAEYIAEKFGLNPASVTTIALAELISGVRKDLWNVF